MQTIYVVHPSDNVGVAIEKLTCETVQTVGAQPGKAIRLLQDLPMGHKAAIRKIACGEPIIKYGAVIGAATKDILMGEWVHLHNMKSCYDERSSEIDPVTGAVKDTVYE